MKKEAEPKSKKAQPKHPCWNCKANMLAGPGDGLKCPKCGATDMGRLPGQKGGRYG